MFNKSGSVMHMLECGIKAHLIPKCLKNGIERSLVVSGKKCNYHLRGRGMGKNGAFRIKLLRLLVVKGEHGILVVFWVKFYRLIAFCVEPAATHKDSNLVTVKGGKNTKGWLNVEMNVNSECQEVHPKLEIKFKYLVYLTA